MRVTKNQLIIVLFRARTGPPGSVDGHELRVEYIIRTASIIWWRRLSFRRGYYFIFFYYFSVSKVESSKVDEGSQSPRPPPSIVRPTIPIEFNNVGRDSVYCVRCCTPHAFLRVFLFFIVRADSISAVPYPSVTRANIIITKK